MLAPQPRGNLDPPLKTLFFLQKHFTKFDSMNIFTVRHYVLLTDHVLFYFTLEEMLQ